MKLTSRKALLKQNPYLAQYVIARQSACYDPAFTFESALGKSSEVQQKHLRIFEKKRDKAPGSLPGSNFYIEHIASLPYPEDMKGKSYDWHFGNGIKGIAKHLGWKNVLVISDYPRSYLGDHLSTDELKIARQRLQRKGLKAKHKGGLVLSAKKADKFFEAMFPLIRSASDMPYVLFTGKNDPIVGEVSQNGEVRFHILKSGQETRLNEALAARGFENGDLSRFVESLSIQAQKAKDAH